MPITLTKMNWAIGFTLFTENPTCVICLSDEPPVTVIGDDFKNLLSQYRESMVEAGTQPLHLDTNLAIQEQDPNRATAEAYIMYMPLEIAAFNLPEKSFFETRITGTARYTWSLLKGDDGIWRIDSYRIAYLQKWWKRQLTRVVLAWSICGGRRLCGSAALRLCGGAL